MQWMVPFNFLIVRYTIYALLAILLLVGCDAKPQNRKRASKALYVEPSIDRRGRFRKGHVRKPVSTSKDAIKNQNRSRYYYQTKGKYRRKSTSK